MTSENNCKLIAALNDVNQNIESKLYREQAFHHALEMFP